MYCKYCGTQVSDTAKFCNNCGGRLIEDKPALTLSLPSSSSIKASAVSPLIIVILILQLIGVIMAVNVEICEVEAVKSDFYSLEDHRFKHDSLDNIGLFSDWSDLRHDIKEDYDLNIDDKSGLIKGLGITFILSYVGYAYTELKRKDPFLPCLLFFVQYCLMMTGVVLTLKNSIERYKSYSGNSGLSIYANIDVMVVYIGIFFLAAALIALVKKKTREAKE